MTELCDFDVLNYAVESGIINVNTIRKKIEMKERKKYLDMHNSKVWKSTDDNWYTYVSDNVVGRRLLKRKKRTDLDDAIVEYYKRMEAEPYIEDVFKDWISAKLSYGEIQKQTYDRYLTDFERFFVGTTISKTKFKYITEIMLEDFIKSTIYEKQLTAKAWSGLRILLNGIFKYAKKRGYTEISITNFMGDLDLSRKSLKKRRFNSEEQVFTDREVIMVNNYINERTPSIIELGILLTFETGLRVGELSAICWDDISGYVLDVNKTEIHYRADDGKYVYEIRDNTKTDAGMRKVILSENALRILKRIRRLNPFGEYVFMKNGKRVRSPYFTKRLLAICKSIGIKAKSQHDVRRTYATKLIDAGVSERTIIDQLGHEDILTSKRYYYYNNKDIEQEKMVIEKALKYN